MQVRHAQPLTNRRMLNQNFVILAAVIGFSGTLGYLISTLKGETKPNRVTWIVWAIAPLLAFGAELSKGVGIQSLMTFVVGFGPLLVLLASFVNKKSEWKLGRLDFICGGLSVLGLILWLVLREGNIAIFFAITADGLAAIPTIVKSFYFPETENYFGFLAPAIGAGITMLTIQNWSFAQYGFPLYILLVCILLTLLIKFKVGRYFTN